jgi:tetratricopeptide (TPR) repeat protein
VSEGQNGDKRPAKGDIPDLLKRLDAASEEDKWKVHYDLVWAYFDDDDYVKALESYEECVDRVPPGDVTDLVIVVSDVLEQYGELPRSVDLLTRRIEELERDGLGDTEEMGRVQLRLAQVLRRQSRFDEGMEHCQLALAIFTEGGVTTEVGVSVLSTMGMIMWEKGDYDMALKFMHQGLERGLEIGADEKLKWIFNNIGIVNYQLGNYSETLEYFENAKRYEKTGNKSFLATVENNIGLVHHDLGEYDKAREYYQKALRLSEDIENFVGTALGFLNLGLLDVEMGRPDSGRDLLDKASSLCRHMKERWIHALAAIGLARAYIMKGNVKLARHNAEEALRFSEEMKAKESRGMALRELGCVAEAEGNAEEARKYHEESVSVFEDMNNLYELAKSLHAYGTFLCGLGGDPTEGRRKLENAEMIAEKIGAKGILSWIKDSLKETEGA